MTAVVRTLPGIVNDHDRPTGAIPVVQVVDEGAQDYDVRLDLSGHIDLHALAQAIHADPALAAEWAIARTNTHVRGIMAASHLRQHPAVRAALTVKLTPAEAGLAADSLAERLEQAALEPARCEHWDGDCNAFVDDRETSVNVIAGRILCPAHYLDVEEHGTPDDRGQYDPWQG